MAVVSVQINFKIDSGVKTQSVVVAKVKLFHFEGHRIHPTRQKGSKFDLNLVCNIRFSTPSSQLEGLCLSSNQIISLWCMSWAGLIQLSSIHTHHHFCSFIFLATVLHLWPYLWLTYSIITQVVSCYLLSCFTVWL